VCGLGATPREQLSHRNDAAGRTRVDRSPVDIAHTTRPYRNVKPETACRQILDALYASLGSDRLAEDWRDPSSWPQNVAMLLLIMRPLVAKLGVGHG